jgi:hypothetical protein
MPQFKLYRQPFCVALVTLSMSFVMLNALVISASAGTAGPSPIAAAKQLIQKAHRVKTLSELNPLVTRKTAALLAMADLTESMMVTGMSEGLGAPKLEKSGEKKATALYLKKQNALLAKYGLTMKSIMDQTFGAKPMSKSISSRGHELLRDVEKLGSPPHSKPAKMTFGIPSADQCAFHIIKGNRVRIMPHIKHPTPMDACIEDGSWRLDEMVGGK